jgi:hypothetical protein
MRARQANWGSAWVATPLSPILHGFVQVPQRRVLLNSPLPQHLGTDYFGVVIPLSRRLPTVLAVFCCRFGLGWHQFILLAGMAAALADGGVHGLVINLDHDRNGGSRTYRGGAQVLNRPPRPPPSPFRAVVRNPRRVPPGRLT